MQANALIVQTQLIEGCLKGDRRSQKLLYDTFSPRMFKVCLRFAKNQVDAEDILQESFVKLFNSLNRYRGEGSFEGWVRRIFVNTAIEHIRKRSLNAVSYEHLENSLIDHQTTPLEKLYLEDLVKIAEQLSDGYQTVFRQYAVEGYSHKEIAHRLGITESTSKSQYSRGKAILRALIIAERAKEAGLNR
ncbi:sigma-70 family RNA polymerase sigma factor [Segetibacter sp. 3557_3]|uniref:RNA polymerase sigma factor n=1 Tax=Segetibacter sp. 3557_3 TaxID=2547429 RepID=UPI001058C17B|nr:sigma-70 family RNA polymerase sigma factor [Segetibacter sp. 3557_3]TDH28994.1 sigma-70 family RNA polymerase sigma factor [Segetibacter sp. 3557_3]